MKPVPVHFRRNSPLSRAAGCVLGVLLLSLVGACTRAQELAAASKSGLTEYLARPEPVYAWSKAGAPTETPTGGMAALALAATDVSVHDVDMTSQEWQGQPWKHRMRVFHPAKPQFPDLALLVVQGGASISDVSVGKILAHFTGATVVQLAGIPNQPLYGRTEDALIAYTFDRYLATGDATWPLLFPMTKSVVKAMDTATALSKAEGWSPLSRFVVTGASKRGWTTWLTAASDNRVIGIVPMVYDNLNLSRQMAHQIESWGAYSEQIADYTRAGLIQRLTDDPRGKQLSAMVDPWAFRERVTVPKLLINGANDPYWPIDALHLYRADLRGPTSVLYVPNAGHGLDGQEERVLATIAAWLRRVAAGKPVPSVAIEAEAAKDGGRVFRLTTDAAPGGSVREARLWVARSATRDFRKARWESVPIRGEGNGWSADVPAALSGTPWTAVFAEADVYGDLPEGLPPMRLSSDVTLWK